MSERFDSTLDVPLGRQKLSLSHAAPDTAHGFHADLEKPSGHNPAPFGIVKRFSVNLRGLPVRFPLRHLNQKLGPMLGVCWIQ
jgi:hypothetical protein